MQAGREVCIGRVDASALLDIVIVFEAALMTGRMHDEDVQRLITRLGGLGLLRRTAFHSGEPANLRVSVAELNQRLRLALGDRREDGGSSMEVVATCHVFEVPNGDIATQVVAAIQQLDPIDVRIHEFEARVEIRAEFPELQPSPPFQSRRAELIQLALEYEGRYIGHQDAP